MMAFLKARWKLITIVMVVLALVAGGYYGWQIYSTQQAAVAALARVGEVSQTTAVSTVDSSGTVSPIQSSNLSWRTTGTVAQVNVKVGDKVKNGDVLMILDPLSVPQSVITAQSDLITAKKTLDDLIKPPDLTVANARKAVADAEGALKTANDELRTLTSPADQSYFDAVNDAKLALTTAQGNLDLSNVSADVQAYYSQVATTNRAYSDYLKAKEKYDNSNQSQEAYDAMKRAEATYQNALSQQQVYELKINMDKSSKTDAVAKAKKKLDDAQATLNVALGGPTSIDLAKARAKVEVAQAQLADAKDKLNKLLAGADPRDIASAMAKLQAAQASADSLMIRAPFDGEILQVNYQAGDSAATSNTAIVLANRTKIYIEVLVDESEVTRVRLGGRASITANPLPDVKIDGVVSRINTIGVKDQGLTKYGVRVDVTRVDPRLLTGMTATVSIVTSVNNNALTVPLDAVQNDSGGEFVNRVVNGVAERVNVKSGQLIDDVVVVTGDLRPGDKVQLVTARSTTTTQFGGPVVR
jgi:HlyD family secretion protein